MFLVSVVFYRFICFNKIYQIISSFHIVNLCTTAQLFLCFHNKIYIPVTSCEQEINPRCLLHGDTSNWSLINHEKYDIPFL